MGVILLERWRDRVPYPELRREAKGAYYEYEPDAVMVEKKASGESLIQDLRMSGIPCIEYSPDRDKVARAHASSALLEAGLVWYIDAPWSREVIDHCAIFPAGDGVDIVDTCTMAWLRLRNMWFLTHPEDPEEDEKDPREREPIYG
jgi:predicted phage terminase large subunit-like protein